MAGGAAARGALAVVAVGWRRAHVVYDDVAGGVAAAVGIDVGWRPAATAFIGGHWVFACGGVDDVVAIVAAPGVGLRPLVANDAVGHRDAACGASVLLQVVLLQLLVMVGIGLLLLVQVGMGCSSFSCSY
jgi:hypothetical protein